MHRRPGREATVVAAVLVAALSAAPPSIGRAAAAAGDDEAGCGEGEVAATGYPAGLLLRKLGYVALSTGAQAPEGEESDALRQVRELEELLFPVSPGVDKIVKIINVISGIFSGAEGMDPGEVSNEDLLWLGTLKRPDIPLQWRGKVVAYLKSFRDEKRWQKILRTWFGKRATYSPMIRGELECRGMPLDLEFVAMIESGYSVGVQSPAGALGLWQFMPGTGKVYGLVQTSWMDQRRNPELSTVAALTYLADLKAKVGSWYLALASYNAGYGTVLNAIKKFNSNDYWALSRTEGALPWETTNYVPKIIAVAVAAANPAVFGLEDVVTEAPLAYHVVMVPLPVKLSQVAKAGGVTVEDLLALNTELKKNRVPPDVLPYPVRLPASVDLGAFEKAFKKQCEGFKPIETYKVRFGDTLQAIAHRSKSTAKELSEINEIDAGEKLATGTLLLVPKPASGAKDAGPVEKPVVLVPEKTFVPPGTKRIFYRIVKGDTLSQIAQYFKVKVADLCLWNDLDPLAVVVADMVLQIFPDAGFDTSQAVVMKESEVTVLVAGSPEHIESLLEAEGKKRVEYTAGAGETLKAIAKKFGMKLSSLQAVNDLAASTVFSGGEKVILYVKPAVYKKHFAGEDAGPPAPGKESGEGEGTGSTGEETATPPVENKAGEGGEQETPPIQEGQEIHIEDIDEDQPSPSTEPQPSPAP